MLVCESKCLRIRLSFLVRDLLSVFGLNSENLRDPSYRLWKGRFRRPCRKPDQSLLVERYVRGV
jgi:hypothetical protein